MGGNKGKSIKGKAKVKKGKVHRAKIEAKSKHKRPYYSYRIDALKAKIERQQEAIRAHEFRTVHAQESAEGWRDDRDCEKRKRNKAEQDRDKLKGELEQCRINLAPMKCMHPAIISDETKLDYECLWCKEVDELKRRLKQYLEVVRAARSLQKESETTEFEMCDPSHLYHALDALAVKEGA